ncbi:hypothetical protein ACWKSP_05355 [Micromonosporaceae bacterium Da 78-11]
MEHLLAGLADNPDAATAPDRSADRVGCDAPASRDDLSRAQARTLAERSEDASIILAPTPIAAITRYADDPSMVVRWALAERPDLPPEVCRLLAEDPVPGVRAELAGNPAIGEDLIRQLATCRMHDVQRRLAHHPRVMLDVLTYLAGSCVAWSPGTASGRWPRSPPIPVPRRSCCST